MKGYQMKPLGQSFTNGVEYSPKELLKEARKAVKPLGKYNRYGIMLTSTSGGGTNVRLVVYYTPKGATTEQMYCIAL
jgi:hypothetical protein